MSGPCSQQTSEHRNELLYLQVTESRHQMSTRTEPECFQH